MTTAVCCRWCGRPASERREVVPAEYTAQKLLRKAAIRLLTGRLGRSLAHTSKRAGLERQIEQAKLELATLNRETAA